MSARFDPASDRASISAALPDSGAGFTLCAWVRPLIDPDNFWTMVRLASGGGTSTVATLGTTATGTSLAYVSPGGVVASGYTLVPNEWARVAIRASGGTGTALGSAPGGAIVKASGPVTSATPDILTVGGRSPSDSAESYALDIAHLRLFSAVLTDAELEAEWDSPTALHASLVGSWPLLVGGQLEDVSGSGLNLTAGATATSTDSGPPISGGASALALGTEVEGFATHSGTGVAPLTLGAAEDGFKVALSTAEAPPLILGASAVGAPEPGGSDVAPVSEVLCSSWADIGDVPPNVRAELEAADPTITDADIVASLLRASELLWALSGRVWYGGSCTETAVLRSYPPAPGTGTWPYDDSWRSCRCWTYGTWVDGRLFPGLTYPGRHVPAPIAVKLPRSPVTAIASVTVDGAPFAAWRLLTAGWIERTDGRPWQVCDGSTEIVYEFGAPPPAGGRDAAVELGVELLRYRRKIKGCRLPTRTTSITRQGLSMEIIDPLEFLNIGGTGLLAVDMWLRAVNPDRSPQAAGVWSPDLPTTIRT